MNMTKVYMGSELPPAKDSGMVHILTAAYFAPIYWENPVPFSRAYESPDDAHQAALEFESRREWC